MSWGAKRELSQLPILALLWECAEIQCQFGMGWKRDLGKNLQSGRCSLYQKGGGLGGVCFFYLMLNKTFF